jgi:hypothetical protein
VESRVPRFQPSCAVPRFVISGCLRAKGESDHMTVPAGVDMIRSTPPEAQSAFAREIWERRGEHGTDMACSFLTGSTLFLGVTPKTGQ